MSRNRRLFVDTSVPFSLNNKSIFITGGASGIGLGTCRRCLKEGARVIVAGIQAPPQTVMEVCGIFFQSDVTDRDQVSDALKKAEAALGTLHVIIHNAGKPGKGE